MFTIVNRRIDMKNIINTLKNKLLKKNNVNLNNNVNNNYVEQNINKYIITNMHDALYWQYNESVNNKYINNANMNESKILNLTNKKIYELTLDINGNIVIKNDINKYSDVYLYCNGLFLKKL
jgi:hypothetical protein